MNSKKMNTGTNDLISKLPEALICHILSFLSTKEAALTSVLSKRWRFSLALVPNLDFDSSNYNHPKRGTRKCRLMRPSFKAFVERTMFLQGNALLNKFSLMCKTRYDQARVDGWIANVLDRGVLDLDLYMSSDGDFPLPSKILMSSTLFRLKLGGRGEEFTIDDIKDVYLPKLKSLYLLDDIVFEETGVKVAKLLSGCPVLEEFVMMNTMWGLSEFCSVSSKTLMRVTICSVIIDENPESVSFDTPNLVYLEFSDVVAIKYPKVKFDSLVEARLGLGLTPIQKRKARYPKDDDEEEEMYGDAADFLTGIRNVKILYLSSDTLEVINFCCKAIPVFNNLIHLTIETHQDVGWDSLPNTLENCPNLETIIFKGLHYKDTNQCEDLGYRFKGTNICWDEDKDEERCVCKPWDGTPLWLSTSPVKTLKVLEFGETTYPKDDFDRQVDLIKHFVETMPNLEQVILYWDTRFDDDLSIQLTEFHMLEKVASSKCEIRIVSDNISYSSTVGSSSSTSGIVFFKNRFPV